MARVKRFWVLPADRTDRGQAEVIYTETTGTYRVEASAPSARGVAEAWKNEAGFRGRQWEVSGAIINGTMVGVGDNQFRTLREAAQAILALTNAHSRTREQARALGLVR